MRTFSLRPVGFATVAIVASLAACGGGGGGGGTSTPSTPYVAPTVALTYPASVSSQIVAGSTSQSAQLSGVGSGYSGSVTIPAASAGAGSIAVTLSAEPPAGAPALAAISRKPAAVGVALSGIVYVSFTPSSTVTFATSPSFTFALAPGYALPANASSYVAFDDPTGSSGWQNLDGPGTATSSGYTFAANPVPMTFEAGVTYYFAWYSTFASPVPFAPTTTPTPTPTASPTPVRTASPTPTVTPSPAPLPGVISLWVLSSPSVLYTSSVSESIGFIAPTNSAPFGTCYNNGAALGSIEGLGSGELSGCGASLDFGVSGGSYTTVVSGCSGIVNVVDIYQPSFQTLPFGGEYEGVLDIRVVGEGSCTMTLTYGTGTATIQWSVVPFEGGA